MKRFLICMVILCLMLSMAAFAPVGVQVTGYADGVDYMSLMLKASEDGSPYAMSMGAIYEQQRNLKINTLGIAEYNTTQFFNGNNSAQEIHNLINDYINPKPAEIPELPAVPEPEPTPVEGTPIIKQWYTEEDIKIATNVLWHEARGIKRGVELACVVYTACNRVDAGYGTLREVLTTKHQFAYVTGARIPNDATYQRCYEIVVDVLYNWNIEKNGGENPSRCLPQGYLWFSGSGGHNWFRNRYSGGTTWNYSLPDYYGEWDV